MAACRDRVPSAGTRTLAVGNSCDKGDTSSGGRKGAGTDPACPHNQSEEKELSLVSSLADLHQQPMQHEGVVQGVALRSTLVEDTQVGDTRAD